jgi:hypothetical protein
VSQNARLRRKFGKRGVTLIYSAVYVWFALRTGYSRNVDTLYVNNVTRR